MNNVLHTANTKNGTISIINVFDKFGVSVERSNNPFVEICATLKDAQVAFSWLRKKLEEEVYVANPYTKDA